jgi:catechol 2,3-dioxygenase-like lactoylglutathione lyase family enzyme
MSDDLKVNSISGVTCYVKDLARTAEFYEGLGFRRGKEEPDRVTFYVNWFFVTFIAQDQEGDAELRNEAKAPNKGSGTFLYIKVDDVEGFHQAVVSKGMKPLGEPQVRPPAYLEFVLRDPDGYNLAFFQKTK